MSDTDIKEPSPLSSSGLGNIRTFLNSSKYKTRKPASSYLQSSFKNSKTQNRNFSLTSTAKYAFLALLVGLMGTIIQPIASQHISSGPLGKKVTIAKAWGDSSVNIWWPVDNARVTGVQPFKALVNGKNLGDYKMYWQVDKGQLNLMSDNYTDYPHKESSVDLTNWSWNGRGPYVLDFSAYDNNNQKFAEKFVSIYLDNVAAAPASNNDVKLTSQTFPAPNSDPAPVLVSAKIGKPLSGVKFYLDPNSNAKRQADAWRKSKPADALMMDKIASQPASVWLGGWNGDIKGDVNKLVTAAASKGAVPTMIVYNIPNRDCGGFSAGGAQTVDAYKAWIKNLAAGIGNRRALIVLEPDAVALTNCLSQAQLQDRYDMLKFAVATLKSLGSTWVYIDAGHANWLSPDEIAAKLKNAGVDYADGFALNTSNFTTTQDNLNYGKAVSSKIGGKHFIIDTSRNGNGSTPDSQWCNPLGRALGSKPTVSTGNPLADAFIWGKQPGESDGQCNGGPSAGVWWPEYALGLAQRANW